MYPRYVSQSFGSNVKGNMYPSLIGKDPCQKSPSSVEMRPFRHDRSRHRIVPPDPNTHEKSKAEDPDHFQSRCGYTVGQTDDQNGADDADYEFLSVHEFAAECITKKTKGELSDDVSDI